MVSRINPLSKWPTIGSLHVELSLSSDLLSQKADGPLLD